MLSCHELFGFMPPALAIEIMEFAYSTDKPVYRETLKAVAEARKVRPAFLERQPRVERHKQMVSVLSRPRSELIAANLLGNWLIGAQGTMLTEFLNHLGIDHENGVVKDFPSTMDDTKLNEGVELLLSKYAPEKVAVYLSAFYSINEPQWPNLGAILEKDTRLHLG